MRRLACRTLTGRHSGARWQIPRWMEKILRIPGGAFCLLLILLPFTLVRLRLLFTLSFARCLALSMLL